jgi:hypothetical protein
MQKNPLIHSLEELSQLTSELTKQSGQLEKWIKALNQFSLAFQNKQHKQLFEEMLSHLAKMNLGQNKATEKKGSATEKKESATEKKGSATEKKGSTTEKKGSATGSKPENFYDLINAPGFSEIVKEVMKYKSKKR